MQEVLVLSVRQGMQEELVLSVLSLGLLTLMEWGGDLNIFILFSLCKESFRERAVSRLGQFNCEYMPVASTCEPVSPKPLLHGCVSLATKK